MNAQPVTRACRAAFESRRCAVVGISPFNSYFSAPRIHRLLGWAIREFESVSVFVPDAPAAYTLEALGYSPERARRKAHRQGCYLRNKIARALEMLAVPEPQRSEMVLDWRSLQCRPRFLASLDRQRALFQADVEFRDACLGASRWVLEGHGHAAGTRDLTRAVDYFLAELPMFAESNWILDSPTAVFCYHQAPEVLRQYYGGRLSATPRRGQGFVVVRAITE